MRTLKVKHRLREPEPTPLAAVNAIFFDVDGVLIDSLESHLQICRDKSREFDLNLKIPDASAFREMVRRGVPISPMKQFFLAVGFPERFAEKANEDYQRDFAARYAPAPFPGAKKMLLQLASTGVELGVVTSNTRAIVESTLGQAAEVFRKDLFFTLDHPRRLGKPQALLAGARKLRVPVRTVLYVGDQPKDFEAARDAKAQFLGVTYGWGISSADTEFETVDTIAELARELRKRVKSLAAGRRSRAAK
jgi:phosphoglycolate phosphatase